ncbi:MULTISPECIES: hypothetical protein [Streptomyces]|uniref:hypothetical protein n=1 Tax=Streptomyces TaxID=1883 RepID=UPI0035D8A0B4
MLIARRDETTLERLRASLARSVAADPSDDEESLIAAINAVMGCLHDTLARAADEAVRTTRQNHPAAA